MKLYQYSSIIVFGLYNKELCDGLSASKYYLGRNTWRTTRALWNEVVICWAKSWQKISIFPQMMLANIWH